MCISGFGIKLQFALGNVWTWTTPFVLIPEPAIYVLFK
jgi:hypothetical protein